MDKLIHTIGRGASRMWARILLPTLPAEGLDVQAIRNRAQDDAVRDSYAVIDETRMNPERMTSGAICMYMLQEMLQTGQYQVEDLVMKYSYLLGEVRGQYTGADHARHLM